MTSWIGAVSHMSDLVALVMPSPPKLERQRGRQHHKGPAIAGFQHRDCHMR
jgi:hypothetical protein